MADNQSHKHRHEWMVLAMWLGMFTGVVWTTVAMIGNMELPISLVFQFANTFKAPANPLTGATGASAAATIILYAAVILFVVGLYFLVSAWMKVGSMLLEVLVHYAREASSGSGDSLFSTLLYIAPMDGDEDKFDPDDADGSMPGEIIRNLAFAWGSIFLIHALLAAIPYAL
ncbi:MAG: hypothetical protein OEV06_00440 [Anaerolineae bacterium]|nr:hypothetical protein [Anaerolineae bacterium]